MLPQNGDTLHQHSFSFFWSRRPHQGGRRLGQGLVAGEYGGAYSTHNSRHGSGHGVLPLIMDPHGSLYVMIHDPVSLNNYIGKQFFSYENTGSASSYSGQESIIQILRGNGVFSISKRFQRSYLRPLLIYHSGHGSQTDKCCHQEKDYREYLADTLDPVCIIAVIGIFGKIRSVRNDPFRNFDFI